MEEKIRNTRVKGESPFRLQTGSLPRLLTLSVIASWLWSCQNNAFWQLIQVRAGLPQISMLILSNLLTRIVHPHFEGCSLQTHARLPTSLLSAAGALQEQAGTQGGNRAADGISSALSSSPIKVWSPVLSHLGGSPQTYIKVTGPQWYPQSSVCF